LLHPSDRSKRPDRFNVFSKTYRISAGKKHGEYLFVGYSAVKHPADLTVSVFRICKNYFLFAYAVCRRLFYFADIFKL